MAAGAATFVVEAGADWATQIYWVAEQTGDPIRARGPMDMDIINPVTGQRLIRLDDGANGGIDNGAATHGIVQLQIAREQTLFFPAGTYVYDLFVFSIGPPVQRVRLLSGSVIVPNTITDLGGKLQVGQFLSSAVLPPDIVLDVRFTGTRAEVSFDNTEPTNQYKSPETGIPMRAGLRGSHAIPVGVPVRYIQAAGPTGPLRDPRNENINSQTLNDWMTQNAVLTVTYDEQFGGLLVSRVEITPGSSPAPGIA
jgi:hypothetical protein